MKDIRKLPSRPAPGLIPEELIGKTVSCPKCGTQTAISWLEKLPFPKQPIEPNAGGGHWVPVGFPVRCSKESCKGELEVNTPIFPNESRWTLYGDEAGRNLSFSDKHFPNKSLNFFCITLAGLHQRLHAKVRTQISDLKKFIKPSVSTDSWAHHFTDVWDSKPASGKFQLANKEAKVTHAQKFAEIIRDAHPELVFFNFSGCLIVPSEPKEKRLHLKIQKEEIFSQSIMSTLKIFREQHKSVSWIFDNVKDATAGIRTEGWANECFLGLQYTPLFTWLSAGATTLRPAFVPPGSHFLLEIADFISYCVAREFAKGISGSPPEFPSRLLGEGFFQGVLGDGNVEYMWACGLPMQRWYGLGNA